MDHKDKYLQRSHHLDFLQGVSETGFVVPEGYFDHLATITSLKASTHETAHSSWKVEDDYFSNLEDQIMAQIQLDQYGLQADESMMTLPDGYFSQLEQKIISKIQPKTPVRRLISPTTIRWAAAACLTVFMGVALFLQLDQEVIAPTSASNLSSISDDSLIKYLETYSETGDLIYLTSNMGGAPEGTAIDQSISADEIENYLANTL
jgi:hypothetical protein